MSHQHRFTGLRSSLTAHRRPSRLERELAEFRSQADLAELAALLDRHPDAETEQLRALVDWTAAA